MDAYLNIAERALSKICRPMKPRDIISYAYQEDLLPGHLYGVRQDKTLHARLSEDIALKGERSRFYRVSNGTFFLETLRLDPAISLKNRERYLAVPRRKSLRRKQVLLLDFDLKTLLRADGKTISVSKILDCLDSNSFSYKSIDVVAGASSLFVVNSFVVVFRDEDVLSFRCGRFFPETDPLFGKRSIGVGGAVYANDRDLLFDSMHGIIGNGINELRYGIGLSDRLAEEARYNNALKPCIVVPVVENEIRTVHVVMAFKCPADFSPSKSALSINDLRWVKAANPANSLADFDLTSRILFEEDFVRDLMRMVSSP